MTMAAADDRRVVPVVGVSGATVTCTYDRNVMVANGDVRSVVSNMVCGQDRRRTGIPRTPI